MGAFKIQSQLFRLTNLFVSLHFDWFELKTGTMGNVILISVYCAKMYSQMVGICE